jgi:ribosomal-protein-alanine N-acetyltransferase
MGEIRAIGYWLAGCGRLIKHYDNDYPGCPHGGLWGHASRQVAAELHEKLMNIQPITLEGRVARLEPLSAHHAAALAEAATPDIFTYMFPPRELSTRGFEEGIARLRSLPAYSPFAIIAREHGRAIGMTSYLDIRPEHRGLEIGFTWIAQPYQGTHVNPECKYMLFRHAFDEQQAVRVQLKTDLRNLRSQRAIEKLGAVREGVLRKHMIMSDGFVRDTVLYSVTIDEWPAVRERLEARLGYVP